MFDTAALFRSYFPKISGLFTEFSSTTMLTRCTWASVRNGLFAPKLLPLLFDAVQTDVKHKDSKAATTQLPFRLYVEGQVAAQAKLSSLFQDTLGSEATFGHISADNPSTASQYEV